MEFEKFVQENRKENVTLYSDISTCSIQKISHRSLTRIEKETGMKTGNAELTTYALEKACADKRNAVSIAVGHSMVTTSVRQSNIQLTCCNYRRNCVKSRLRCSLLNCDYTLQVLQQVATND